MRVRGIDGWPASLVRDPVEEVPHGRRVRCCRARPVASALPEIVELPEALPQDPNGKVVTAALREPGRGL